MQPRGVMFELVEVIWLCVGFPGLPWICGRGMFPIAPACEVLRCQGVRLDGKLVHARSARSRSVDGGGVLFEPDVSVRVAETSRAVVRGASTGHGTHTQVSGQAPVLQRRVDQRLERYRVESVPALLRSSQRYTANTA